MGISPAYSTWEIDWCDTYSWIYYIQTWDNIRHSRLSFIMLMLTLLDAALTKVARWDSPPLPAPDGHQGQVQQCQPVVGRAQQDQRTHALHSKLRQHPLQHRAILMESHIKIYHCQYHIFGQYRCPVQLGHLQYLCQRIDTE